MDTKSVIVLSPIDSFMPVVPLRRREKGQKGKITIECFLILKTYNNGMKGTDLIHQLKASHQIDRRYPKKFILEYFLILWTSAM